MVAYDIPLQRRRWALSKIQEKTRSQKDRIIRLATRNYSSCLYHSRGKVNVKRFFTIQSTP